MTVTIHLVVLFVLAVLTGSSQTRGQSSVAPPVFITQSAFQSHANTSASPDLTEDPGNEVPKRTRDPASRDETMTITGTKGSVDPENVTNAVFETGSLSMSSAAAATPPHADAAVVASAHTVAASSPAAAHGLSSTPPPWGTTPLHRISPAESRAPLTGDPPTAVSTQPAHTVQGTSSTARSSTAQPQSESLTIDRPLTSALGPAGPRHREVPSELNIGDEDLKVPRHRPSSPLDPLLAGLLSVFIVTTAIIFVGLFLKLRQRTNHPEFHRLQDLPMDDLMEDTPLSRYTY